MKRKQIFPLSLTLLLMISILTFAIPVRGYAGTNLYADPANKTLGPLPPPVGETYTFDIMLENGTDVVTIACDLDWDPTMVNITSIVVGNALPGGALLIGSWNSAGGYIDDITVGVLGTSYAVDNKTFVTVTVEVMGFTGPGGTVIDILGMSCWDKFLTEFLSGDSAYDHTMYSLTPPPTEPTAAFTWAPPFPLEGVAANFDASTSSNGFDGNNTAYITEYHWDFDDGNQTMVTVDTIVHVFAVAGTYDVNLTVVAPPGIGADPGYVGKDTVIHTVMVIAPALGRAIDLYTQDWRYAGCNPASTIYTGEGMPNGTQVDSFAPQDEVILYAKLTYNLEPIANKEVAFEVHGPTNPYHNVSVYRQAFTDECGIANISFRIPWPDVHAEEIIFGNWTVLAKASVAEETVADWHWFKVGWIVQCMGIKLYDWMSVIRIDFEELQDVFINVTVLNIAMTPRNVTLTIVIYDELGVPIGSVVGTYQNVPPGTSELDKVPILLHITIPEWAYVGFGMVYVNLLSALPWDCGVCYGPECSTIIQIKRGPGC